MKTRVVDEKMTRRHRQVLECIGEGLTSSETGLKLHMSMFMVEKVIMELKWIFVARNKHHLVARAFRTGWLE